MLLSFPFRISISDQGNLVVRDASKSDAGLYVCRAHNMVGTRSSEPAKLRVLGERMDYEKKNLGVFFFFFRGRSRCRVSPKLWVFPPFFFLLRGPPPCIKSYPARGRMEAVKQFPFMNISPPFLLPPFLSQRKKNLPYSSGKVRGEDREKERSAIIINMSLLPFPHPPA